MTTRERKRASGARDLLLLVISRTSAQGVEVAGVDPATGQWFRFRGADEAHGLPLDAITLTDGTHLQTYDTVRLTDVLRTPQPPLIEAAAFAGDRLGDRVAHLEARAISRTLAEISVPHLETLLPMGKRVLTARDFLPGGRQRSIALLRPDQLQQIHFGYDGEAVRVGVSFRHRGQAYGGPAGLPCQDIRLRAFARDVLRKEGTLTVTLDGRACYSRFACGRIYLCVGLVPGEEGTYWPQVLGFHPIREYAAPIDYDRL